MGHDAQLLPIATLLPPSVQLRLLESTISVSTLGELKLLEEVAPGTATTWERPAADAVVLTCRETRSTFHV